MVLTGGETDITETVDEDDLLELEREAFMTLVKHPGDPRAHRAHARDRQAAEELTRALTP